MDSVTNKLPVVKKRLRVSIIKGVHRAYFVSICNRCDDEHGCSSTEHGVDLDVAKEQLSRISQCSSQVVTQLVGTLQVVTQLAGTCQVVITGRYMSSCDYW